MNFTIDAFSKSILLSWLGWDDVLSAVYKIFVLMDAMVYHILGSAYSLLWKLASASFANESIINDVIQRVNVIIGVTMLFVVIFSLMKGLTNPDDLSKNAAAPGKIVTKVMTSLIMLVLIPFVFKQAFLLQQLIMNNNVIGRIIMPSSTSATNTGTIDGEMAGHGMAVDIFTSFFYENPDNEDIKKSVSAGGFTKYKIKRLNPSIVDKAETDLGNTEACTGSGKTIDCSFDAIKQYIKLTGDFSKFGQLTEYVTSDSDVDSNGENKMIYRPLWGYIAALICTYIFLSYAIDMAVRAVKLSFYQIIAPIPILIRIVPGKEEVFKKYLKETSKTFLEVFLRVATISFAVVLLSIIGNGSFNYTSNSKIEVAMNNNKTVLAKNEKLNDTSPRVESLTTETQVTVQKLANDNDTLEEKSKKEADGLVKVLLMIGILIFAKRAPKLIEEIFGIKTEGGFGIGKKLKEAIPKTPKFVNSLASRATGAVAGAAGSALAAKGNKNVWGDKDLRKSAIKSGAYGGFAGKGIKQFSTQKQNVFSAIEGPGKQAGIFGESLVSRAKNKSKEFPKNIKATREAEINRINEAENGFLIDPVNRKGVLENSRRIIDSYKSGVGSGKYNGILNEEKTKLQDGYNKAKEAEATIKKFESSGVGKDIFSAALRSAQEDVARQINAGILSVTQKDAKIAEVQESLISKALENGKFSGTLKTDVERYVEAKKDLNPDLINKVDSQGGIDAVAKESTEKRFADEILGNPPTASSNMTDQSAKALLEAAQLIKDSQENKSEFENKVTDILTKQYESDQVNAADMKKRQELQKISGELADDKRNKDIAKAIEELMKTNTKPDDKTPDVKPDDKK